MAQNRLLIGDMPPGEREAREKLQDGLPWAMNGAAELVILKRQAISTVLWGDVKATQFMTSAVAAVNELPVGATPGSVCHAVFNAASLGLMFGAVRGEAYLVPYRNRKKSERAREDVSDVQLIVGYKGFTALAYKTNFLQSFTTEVVLDNEQFEMWGDTDGKQIKHMMVVERDPLPDGRNIVAAYCTYRTRTGGRGVVVIGKKKIDRLKPANNKIWDSNYPEMAQKTAIRAAAKEWDLTEQLRGAISLDEQYDAGVAQAFLFNPNLIEEQQPRENKRQKTSVSDRNEELARMKREADGGNNATE